MPSAAPTIITKMLLPSRRPSLLSRPRLVDFIHSHIDLKLVLISAGAGYGKTSLLTEFVHDTDLPVCWLSLDEGDRDLRVFLDYLLGAIRCRFPDFGRQTGELLRNAGALPDLRAIVGALATDIYADIASYFVLVLDDYHLMDESLEVNQFLDLLLRHLPANCHLILSSRTLPTKLTMTRLVARQEIAGLGVSDLRFTAEEIQALMRQNYEMELPDDQAAAIAERSEGWITGILLTTHDLWKGLFRNILRVQGDESQVFDYLASEVFALQPPARQRFLLATAVLDRMNPSLCNALLGISDAGEILTELEQNNLFTFRLEGEGSWFRYHHLFRGFLLSRGREQDAERYLALHGQAGQLFAERGLWPEAIAQYLQGGFWEGAAAAMEQVAPQALESGQWTTLAQWVDALPPATRGRHPWLLHHRAKLHMEAGQSAQSRELFEQAKAAFERDGDRVGVASALVEEGILLQHSGQVALALDNARGALQLLGEDGTVIAGRAHRGLGSALIMQGHAVESVGELEQALAIYERLGRYYDVALVHHELGLAHDRLGNAGLAALHWEQARKYWQRVGNVAGLANTLNSLGVALYTQGQYAQALEVLEEALEKTRQASVPRVEAYVLASLADLYRDLDDLPLALQAYEHALEISKRSEVPFIVLYALLGLGDIYRLQDNLDAASYYIEQGQQLAQEGQSRYDLGLYKLAHGALALHLGDRRGGERELREAAQLFEETGAKTELTKARLHLAHVAFLDGDKELAAACLDQVVALARGLDYTQFLVAEARRLPQLIAFGVALPRRGRFFQELSAHLRELVRLNVAALREAKAPEEASHAALLELYAFGNAAVTLDGRPLTSADWDSSVAKELFFLLSAHPEGLRKDEIIECLWRDVPPGKANSTFHSTVYRVRRALWPGVVVREGQVYRLNVDIPHTSDVHEFERLWSEAQAQPERMEACYRRAIELYKGEYMADAYSDWCLERRDQLKDQFVAMLTDLSTYYAQHGRYEESAELAKRALSLDAYREALYRQIMQCYAQAGNRSAALRYYQACAQTLQVELGIEPELETVTLYNQILLDHA